MRSDRQRVFERKPAIAYAGAENADVYQRVMRVLFENKRVLGARLTEDVIADRLWRDHGYECDSAALVRHLDQLAAWGAIDRQYDAGHARNLDEFKRRRHNYAITQAGELAERFLEDLDNLRERVGALEASRLQAIFAELAVIVRELESGEPDPQLLRTGLDNLRGELEALDQGASDFMAQLANVLASTEAVNDDSFLVYKDRVIRYLSGFASDFRRCAQRVEDQILRVEELGVEPMLALAAAVGRAARVRKDRGGGRRAAPCREARCLAGAFGVVRVRRPRDGALAEADRDARRRDRLGRCQRHTARCTARAADRPFGRVPASGGARAARRRRRVPPRLRRRLRAGRARHFYGIDDDPQKAELPQIGWQQGPAAPVEASLYRPGARAAGSGHGARLVDTTARSERFAEQCVREQAELERALERFRGKGALALSDLGTLETEEFRHLLGWLDRALLARAGPDGVVRALSADGLYELELHPPASAEKRARIATAAGVLVAPDFRLEVRER